MCMANNDHDLNTSLHNILYYFNPRKLVKYSSGSRFRSGNKNEGSWPQISCLFEGALVALTSDSPSKILSYTVCVEAKLDESQWASIDWGGLSTSSHVWKVPFDIRSSVILFNFCLRLFFLKLKRWIGSHESQLQKEPQTNLKKIKLDLMTQGTFQMRQVILDPPKSVKAQCNTPNLASTQIVQDKILENKSHVSAAASAPSNK